MQIIAEEIEFAESKNAQSGNGGGSYGADRMAPADASADGFMPVPDGVENDLPFK